MSATEFQQKWLDFAEQCRQASNELENINLTPDQEAVLASNTEIVEKTLDAVSDLLAKLG